MVITKLTKEFLPEFIFLMDAILESNKGVLDTEEILQVSEEKGHVISSRTFQRAFELRKALKEENFETPTVLPSKKTLDALTIYYYGGNPDSFRDLIQNKDGAVDKEQVQQHYEAHKPSDKIIKKVFDQPKKLQLQQEYIEGLELLLYELKNQPLETFVGKLVDRQLQALREELGPKELKEELEGYIEKRLKQEEKRRKRSSIIYRFLGGIALFFMGTPQFDDLKTEVLSAFFEDFDNNLEFVDEDGELEDELLDEV